MNIKEVNKFKDIFIGWTEKEINIAYQMVLFLRKLNISIEDFEKFALYLQEQTFYNTMFGQNFFILQMEYLEKNSRRCGKCGGIMNISSVNDTRCSQIPNKKIRSVFTCADMQGCGHQVWSEKPVMLYLEKQRKQFMRSIEGMSEKEIAELELDRKKYFKNTKRCGGKNGK